MTERYTYAAATRTSGRVEHTYVALDGSLHITTDYAPKGDDIELEVANVLTDLFIYDIDNDDYLGLDLYDVEITDEGDA